MAWAVLLAAAMLEVVWAVALKQADGFTRLWPSAIGLAAAAASFFLLANALRTLPIGTAYAVWVGIGALGAAILGIVLLREPVTFARMFFLAMLLVAIAGVKMTSPE